MLTAKQELFVNKIIEGMSQADAYRAAYSTKKMNDKTIHEAASRLANDSKVAARLAELRGQLTKATIMSAQERLEYLTRIVNGTEKEIIPQIVGGEVFEFEAPTSVKTRLNALDIMNKMTGEYVTKVEGSLNVTKLEDLI